MPLIHSVQVHGSRARARAREMLLDRVDRLTRQILPEALTPGAWTDALSAARFSPALPVRLAGTTLPDGAITADVILPGSAPYAAAVDAILDRHIGERPAELGRRITPDIDAEGPCFIVTPVVSPESASPLPRPASSTAPAGAPVGQPPSVVSRWFDNLTTLVIPERDGTLATARKGAEAYAQASKAGNTVRAYRSAVRSWCRWAATHGLPALPARSADLAAYFADMAMRKRALTTIETHRAALRYLHHLASVSIPTAHASVTTALAGIRREAETPLPRAKTALTWEMLLSVLAPIDSESLAGARDRAILLLGFAGAFRRSELVSLLVGDITLDDDGMTLRLNRSKGDARRQGVVIGVPRGITSNCPVLACERWLRLSGITEGPVFRRVRVPARGEPGMPRPRPRLGTTALSDRAIADIVRTRCAAAGLEGDFAGHSLRRGAITTGAGDGYDLLELKRFSRHRSLQMVEGYIDAAAVKDRNPGRSRF